ncbi:hypothetical protein C2R22_24210 (plasmid) [Salinigranum rubrum]|uniref:Thiamine pyrophosphate enzyme N-terminal TPP-binding domain-containing protein n=1 Tax=Salinigranum rubrum TaxID=755307 RepID=A0A2I8VRV1_9EURY|nr:thiamine pyrophosphate-binding protein [Salinigranum rubrum]AUV84637.1 hypothetical protein C2R22_24210 [Salinigranum rubrum]
MKAREAMIRLLRFEDVDILFTLLSGDFMGSIAEIEEKWGDEIRTIHSRHEQGAMAIVDRYTRASDDISVCVVGRGPDIAQTGTSLVTAKKRGSKLMVLVPSSAVSSRYDTKGFKQETYLESTIETTVVVQSVDDPWYIVPTYEVVVEDGFIYVTP